MSGRQVWVETDRASFPEVPNPPPTYPPHHTLLLPLSLERHPSQESHPGFSPAQEWITTSWPGRVGSSKLRRTEQTPRGWIKHLHLGGREPGEGRVLIGSSRRKRKNTPSKIWKMPKTKFLDFQINFLDLARGWVPGTFLSFIINYS